MRYRQCVEGRRVTCRPRSIIRSVRRAVRRRYPVGGKRYEAKVRASGFKQIYDGLGDNAGLFIRSDRKETLIVLRAADFIELMTKRKPGA